jgi:hypothetical protein
VYINVRVYVFSVLCACGCQSRYRVICTQYNYINFILALLCINIINIPACKIYIIRVAFTFSSRLNDFEFVRAPESSLPRVYHLGFLFFLLKPP